MFLVSNLPIKNAYLFFLKIWTLVEAVCNSPLATVKNIWNNLAFKAVRLSNYLSRIPIRKFLRRLKENSSEIDKMGNQNYFIFLLNYCISVLICGCYDFNHKAVKQQPQGSETDTAQMPKIIPHFIKEETSQPRSPLTALAESCSDIWSCQTVRPPEKINPLIGRLRKLLCAKLWHCFTYTSDLIGLPCNSVSLKGRFLEKRVACC